MKQRIGQGRTLWLGGALLATLLAAQWVSGEDGGTDSESPSRQAVQPVQPIEEKTSGKEAPREEVRRGGNEVQHQDGDLDLNRLERRKFSSEAANIFTAQSWVPPPPPMKPQPPSPPPMQFKYLGKVIEGDEMRVFLALGERNYIVKPGESINNQYRLDEVNDHSVTFTYLPLNAKQMLATAGAGSIP